MNWKDLVSEKVSKKARMVLIGIAALVYVHTETIKAVAEGKSIPPAMIYWAIGGIIGITVVGIAAQWSIEFFVKDKQNPPAEPGNQE